MTPKPERKVTVLPPAGPEDMDGYEPWYRESRRKEAGTHAPGRVAANDVAGVEPPRKVYGEEDGFSFDSPVEIEAELRESDRRLSEKFGDEFVPEFL